MPDDLVVTIVASAFRPGDEVDAEATDEAVARCEADGRELIGVPTIATREQGTAQLDGQTVQLEDMVLIERTYRWSTVEPQPTEEPTDAGD